MKIKTKEELLEALDLLQIPPNMNAANMFVPGKHEVDEMISGESSSSGMHAAVVDVLWEVFGTPSAP